VRERAGWADGGVLLIGPDVGALQGTVELRQRGILLVLMEN